MTEALKKEAVMVVQKPEVMEYLKSHHVELSQKIEKINQSEKELKKGIDLEMEMDRGLSR